MTHPQINQGRVQTYRSLRDTTLLDLGRTMSSAMGQCSFKYAVVKELEWSSKRVKGTQHFF